MMPCTSGRTTRDLLLCLSILWVLTPAAGAQPAFQVADLNTATPRGTEAGILQPPAVLGTELFFSGDDGIHGYELWKVNLQTGATSLVKDICPGACWSGSISLTVWNGQLYFFANDRTHGTELWRSDGTEAGTVRMTDLVPGQRESGGFGSAILGVGDTLFFTADDGVHGRELWKTDGASFQLVADISPGPRGSDPYLWLSAGGRLVFAANDGTHGDEVWTSDGTEEGTALLKDINPNLGSSTFNFPTLPDSAFPAFLLADGTFLFRATDGANGEELWKSDGTEAGTVLLKDISPGSAASFPSSFASYSGKVYFSAATGLWSTDGTGPGTVLVKEVGDHARTILAVWEGKLFFGTTGQIWKSDGTEAGTSLVATVTTDITALLPASGSVLFFAGAEPSFFPPDELELWRTDGTEAGTALVKDFGPLLRNCQERSARPRAGAGEVYFHNCEPGSGEELWKSDGTAAGTLLVQAPDQTPSIWSSSAGFLEGLFETLGTDLIFSADDGLQGTRLWRTDGTPGGAQLLSGSVPAGSWDPFVSHDAFHWVGRIGDTLLFLSPARSLWTTDGTAAGTGEIFPPGSIVSPFHPTEAVLGQQLFFSRDTAGTGAELWKTDGTAAGTVLVKDIQPGSSGSNPFWIAVAGPYLLLSANDGATGTELWRTDGTEAGTVLVKDINTVFSSGSHPSFRGRMGPYVFLGANDTGSASVLWRTDGTEAGTIPLGDLASGPYSPRSFTPAGGKGFFLATSPGVATALWVTDGTLAGTRLVKDIFPDSFSTPSEFGELLALGDRLYFSAMDTEHGWELWTSDGTEAGTRMVKDISPGTHPSEPSGLTRVRNRVFFIANDGSHGRELWVSDGTEAGTRMVKDILPGSGSGAGAWPLAGGFRPLGHALLFSATDGIHGLELWVSDGTTAGTRRLTDIAPGPLPSSPAFLADLFPNVYFVANDGTTGRELWAIPRAALGSTFGDVPPTHWAWRYVEALVESGLTGGCGGSSYCPDGAVTRAQLAIFLERGVRGVGFTPPPATGTIFEDVPVSYWAAPWIEIFAADGYTSGCSTTPPLYCPDQSLTRAEMAVFLLRARHGSAYTPPPATGTVFTDVPLSYWAAPWIEQLAAEGITGGCAPGVYCPDNPVNRAEMAVFLTRTFGLPLP